jgi:hypothetical protein
MKYGTQWLGCDEARTRATIPPREDDGTVSIETTGGRMAAQLGDFIVKSGAEDFAVCQLATFAATHDPA